MLVFTGSCKVYTIPVASFREQFQTVGPEKSRRVRTRNPSGFVNVYDTYPMDYIYCENKAGKKYRFPVGPALTISFIDTNNRRTPFYLDLITVSDTLISGYQMRLVAPTMFNAVAAGAVRKITIHNSGKRVHYID